MKVKIKEIILEIIWHIVFLVLCIPVLVKVAYWSIINKEHEA